MSRPCLTVSSASPLFDGNRAVCWFMTMRNDVTNARFKNIVPGVLYTFLFRQDNTGGRSFEWPPLCVNPIPIDQTPHAVTVQNFIGSTGGQLIANLPGTFTER